ncbi:MAG: class I SAM-dependent methyltransferase, partial [Myxococcota bacterium]
MSDAPNPWETEEYARLAGFGGTWRDTWYHDDFLALMAHRWKLREATSLLDLGCGAGHWGQRLAHFLPDGAKVVGTDIDPGFAEQAQTR